MVWLLAGLRSRYTSLVAPGHGPWILRPNEDQTLVEVGGPAMEIGGPAHIGE